jgi:gentisate 1,2-dioxygenase
MAIDIEHTHTVEVGYDEFCGALAARDLKSLWSLQQQLMPDVPLPATQAWLWKWDTIYPLAKRAGEIISIERGGDRRVLAFANPGLHGLPFTSTTLWGAIQYLGPGETAPAHRHTPSAIRFVMVGSGVYTTVDGDACEMEPGDLVLTPNWNWHDHNNYGGEPMVWFDGLDLPLMTTLESVFFENHPDTTQPVRGHNLSEQLFTGPGLLDAGAADVNPSHSPLLRYRYGDTDRQLTALHEGSPGPEVTVEYRNPVTGGPVVSTFTCEMTRLYPGARTNARRKTGSSVYVAFRGAGRTVINGAEFLWNAGDVFVTPSWAAVDHEAFEEADLFVISDKPVLQALHVFRESMEAQPQDIVETFSSSSRGGEREPENPPSEP